MGRKTDAKKGGPAKKHAKGAGKEERNRTAANGEGGVRRRSDGRWEARVTVGRDRDGSQLRRSFYGETRAKAVAAAQEALKKVREGTYVEPSEVTVDEWMTAWLERYVRQSVRRPTYGQYESINRLHITPYLGHIRARDLQPAEVQQFLNDEFSGEATGRKMSATMVGAIHTVLHAALKQAALEGIVARNVADYVRRPRGPKRTSDVLTQEETQQLIRAAMADRLGPAIITLASTGLRVDELVALQWSTVDLDAGTLRVVQGASRVSDGTGHTEVIIDDPKTASGRRTVPIPPPVLAMLHQWHKQQAEERLLAGPDWQEGGFVFTDHNGGMLDRWKITRTLKRLCGVAGIKRVTPHVLRHSYATRLSENGEHPRTAQELLGHSQVAMTMGTYTHVLSDTKRKAADRLAGLFEVPDSGRGSVGVRTRKSTRRK